MNVSDLSLQNIEELSKSNNYKERFLGEYLQLRSRYEKLHTMIVRYEAGVLDYTPLSPVALYKKQENAMKEYLTILEARAVLERINLKVVPKSYNPETPEPVKADNGNRPLTGTIPVTPFGAGAVSASASAGPIKGE